MEYEQVSTSVRAVQIFLSLGRSAFGQVSGIRTDADRPDCFVISRGETSVLPDVH